MTQLYFHDTITTPDGARWLLEIYISPAPDTADEPDPPPLWAGLGRGFEVDVGGGGRAAGRCVCLS